MMTRRIFTFFLVLLMFWFFTYGKKRAELPEIKKPVGMAVDDTQLYVTEIATVFIYSLKDFKFIKKFGSQGQGPQEFQVLPHVPIGVDASTDKLIVTSIRKISYFTKQGEFIKEEKALGQAYRLRRFGDKFLGWSFARDKGISHSTVCIFDSKLNKLKEVYRVKDSYQGPGRGYRVLPKVFTYHSYDNKIIVPGKDDNTIDIFDSNLKKLFSIRIDQERRKVDQKFKDQLTHYYKTSPESKKKYESMLRPLIWPDYFPVIADFFVDEATIYVLLWKEGKEGTGGNEFFTYDMTGKFKKRVNIPIRYESELRPYPTLVHKGKLYQLVEDENKLVWEFHMSHFQ
ncbi:MAG: hypothetical protein GTO45_41730 [Candidatus Aminicenantes bacterium]|nr:hypothetical protein [Candidatus Aminicenantes bacterium]NIM85132.1 hypothetical protein [Candidatus Aminicenantes bacterium]NIN24642.1 hypothetical protein [Candidatus Aminicenantes bacterium]NIN48403.1 hypothetical protein [Candidatus Aminicenantes bacterium]NIN91306.1 hypothetical protein [Candidatus Aminicenantes bacterium]